MKSDVVAKYPPGTIFKSVFEKEYFEVVTEGVYKKLKVKNNGGSMQLTDEFIELKDEKEYDLIYIG